ncbi:MAG: carbon-nitrogen hydrolase family protein [Campylobacterota bacterium]
MTTSNSRSVVSLCFPTDPDFDTNLERLRSLITQAPEDAIVVAPEVCLSGFAYDRFDEAADFTVQALDALLGCAGERLVIFTAITRTDKGMFNVAYALHAGRIVHTQAKAKLFALGGEEKYFLPGNDRDIVPFEFEGIRIGLLICFELRFKTLWQRLEGCDLIAVCAQWGKLRSEHFLTLTNALAVMNQCYVVASDAANEDTSGMSGIITPFGGEIRNNGSQLLASRYEARTVASMRRYLDVGIA